MNVWIFQTGEPLHIDGGNVRSMRAMNLSNALVEAGHDVVLWSSDFYHQEKRHRFGENHTIDISDNLQIRLLHSMGYSRNVGLGRLIDHFHLAINLKRILLTEQNMPDVAFVGYPPIEAAAVMIRWLNKKGIPTLLDVKDLWPSMFIDAFPVVLKQVAKFFFWPYFYYGKRAIREATGVSAMAGSFLDWVLRFAVRSRSDNDGVFPLSSPTIPISQADMLLARHWWDEIGVCEDPDMARICFVGSFMSVFDFEPIRQAASRAMSDGISMNLFFAVREVHLLK